MIRPMWERLAPLAGLAFAITFVASLVMANIAGGGDSTQDVANWLNKSQGHRILEGVCVYLALAAGLGFLWFLTALTNRLRRAEGDGGMSRMASIAGAVFVSMLYLYASSLAVLAFSRSIGEDKTISVETVHFSMMAGAAFLISSMFAAGGVMLAIGVATLTSRAFPAWFGWLSLLGAVIVPFGIFFFPAAALPIWVLVASFVMLQADMGARSSSMAPAPAR